ncbi:MAG: hypothetical protein RL514_513 [Verrucomicrobiota bacterium]|jgi:hypothetical protein
MKRTLAIAVLSATAFTGAAETFLGVTSATNRLVVGTNEAIFISRLNVTASSFQLVKDGSTLSSSFNFGSDRIDPASPVALAGPCELILPSQAAVHFQRLTTSSILTFVLPVSLSTNTTTISVPSGKTIRVFRPLPLSLTTWLRLSRGTNSFTFNAGGPGGALAYFATEEFTGPLDVIFLGPSVGTEAGIFSYAMTEDAQIAPAGVAIQSPTGQFHLEVERSTNLTNWSPAVIQSLVEDQKAFYRLRITK